MSGIKKIILSESHTLGSNYFCPCSLCRGKIVCQTVGKVDHISCFIQYSMRATTAMGSWAVLHITSSHQLFIISHRGGTRLLLSEYKILLVCLWAMCLIDLNLLEPSLKKRLWKWIKKMVRFSIHLVQRVFFFWFS